MPATMINPVATGQPDRMWSVKQVAAFLGMSTRTVYRMAEKKELPAYWIKGMWRFKEMEIREWLAEHSNRQEEG